MTITERISELDKEDKAELLNSLRLATLNLAQCWDALRDAEHILNETGEDFEVQTDHIEVICGDLDIPPSTSHLKMEDFIEALEEKA